MERERAGAAVGSRGAAERVRILSAGAGRCSGATHSCAPLRAALAGDPLVGEAAGEA